MTVEAAMMHFWTSETGSTRCSEPPKHQTVGWYFSKSTDQALTGVGAVQVKKPALRKAVKICWSSQQHNERQVTPPTSGNQIQRESPNGRNGTITRELSQTACFDKDRKKAKGNRKVIHEMKQKSPIRRFADGKMFLAKIKINDKKLDA